MKRTLSNVIFLVSCALIGVVVALISLRRVPRGSLESKDTDVADISSLPKDRGNRREPPRHEGGGPPLLSERKRPPLAYSLVQLTNARLRDLYNAEPRDPEWAPAMEAQLTSRYRAEMMAAVPGVTLSDVECRLSSCRLEAKATKEAIERLSAAARHKWVYQNQAWDAVVKHLGPFGASWSRVKNGDAERDTIVVVFNEEQMNPLDYAKWAENATARYLARRQADVEKGIDPDAPKPLPPELQ